MGTRYIYLSVFLAVITIVFSFDTANVLAQWTAPTATPPNNNPTLNFGGGAFEEVGSVIRQGNTPAYDEDFVFGGPQLDDDGDASHDARMFFDKSTGAFRAGYVPNGNWDQGTLGGRSVAFGYGTAATGYYSYASGIYSFAQNTGAFVHGYRTKANGRYSFSVGSSTTAEGDLSMSLGEGVYNNTAKSFMVGFTYPKDSAHTVNPGLFVNSNNNVGIGTSALSSGLRLDVAGKVGATEYCDEDGNNCTAAASLGSGGGGGGVNSIIAGSGISVSGSTGDVTITNNFGTSISSSEITDGTITYSDIDTNSVQRRVSSSCAAGSSIRVINSNGTVVCENDDTGSVSDVWVNTSGDTMTGTLRMSGRDITDVDDIYVNDLYDRGSGSEIDVHDSFDMNDHAIRNVTAVDTVALWNSNGSNIVFDEADINMDDNWILNARYRLNDCYWTGGTTGGAICNNGYVMKGGDSDGDYFSAYCCRD